ncbi:alpha/beta hydrolase [Caldimonas brevitalea]|uniref:BD-FAE-like domain-containing protein n=1 Tax=Caldimonas brevitalea TaxID=413882 RepID=A0A0G3BV74_9BURK|nr:alpha/beta hydrolase [Caldimonas brevitalea]AKJ31933.1 hypothetical protein AAW51_5242 [Caldimonas brevitalea]
MNHLSRCGATALFATLVAWALPALGLTQEECEQQGFEQSVAGHVRAQPVYDGVHHLDLYLPAGAASAPAPVLVYLHGGGWGGDNWRLTCFGAWLINLVQQGFAVASVEYTPAQPVPPTLGGSAENVVRQVREVKHAIRWLKSQAAVYRLDVDRVVLAGGSAGGHLAALAGLTYGEPAYEPEHAPPQHDARVHLVFPNAGVYDIGTFSDGWGTPLVAEVFGCWPTNIESWRPCSDTTLYTAGPIRHVDPSDPKVYLMHGDLDPVVLPNQADAFAAVLCGQGRLAHYTRTVSDELTQYGHNLEYYMASNPYIGGILLAGLADRLTPNCS